MKSQNQRIYEMLVDRGSQGVCASELRRLYIGRPAARIHDLKDPGQRWRLTIDTIRWCEVHGHAKGSPQVRYVLRSSE